MAKVITFSRTFQKNHPKAGQATHFVEKFWNSISATDIYKIALPDEIESFVFTNFKPKHTTIRKGKRFKKGDLFSPRVWGDDINPKSGKSGAYHSKQIILAPDTEVKQVWDIDIYPNNEIHINGVHFATFGSENCQLLANNDGLEMKDFIDWFSKLPFEGQIICWNDDVKYS